jgi:flagellar export protein FliJ
MTSQADPRPNPSASPLDPLVDLRKRDVERQAASMERQRAVGQRFRDTLARLDTLYQGSGASGTLPPVLSANCGDYKLAVLQLAEAHRTDLALHEADMAVAQRALADAARRHEALSQHVERQVARRQDEAKRLAQKQQDEIASQMWWRREPAARGAE